MESDGRGMSNLAVTLRELGAGMGGIRQLTEPYSRLHPQHFFLALPGVCRGLLLKPGVLSRKREISGLPRPSSSAEGPHESTRSQTSAQREGAGLALTRNLFCC